MQRPVPDNVVRLDHHKPDGVSVECQAPRQREKAAVNKDNTGRSILFFRFGNESKDMSITLHAAKTAHPDELRSPMVTGLTTLFQMEKKVGLIFFYPVDKTSAI